MARKSEILPTDRTSRRSTLTVPVPSSSSSSASLSSSSNESQLIQTLRDQNRILAQRNAIYARKLTDLESRLQDAQSTISQMSSTVMAVLNAVEDKVHGLMGEMVLFVRDLRAMHGVDRSWKMEGSTAGSSGTGSGSGRGGGPAFDIGRDTESLKSSKRFEVPQYFKKKDDAPKEQEEEEEEEGGNFSTILEILEPSRNEQEEPVSNDAQSSGSSREVEDAIANKIPIGNYNSLTTDASKLEEPEPVRPRTSRPRRKTMIPKPSLSSEPEDIKTPTPPSPPSQLKQEPSSQSPPRRPTRARKEVSYKPLSLNAKMRRESVKMLDAVGENVLINYGVSKDGHEEEKKQSKRRPLLNITNTSNSNRKKRKSIAADTPISSSQPNSDLSIFDFDQVDVKPPKSRRYTTIG
ncbi:hypothetical protein Cantr_02965 [Candida viswanathii]|uniref:Shugoshin n=1 Tax=Candida viswanathii TaxID=5486 RepID=A0A367YN04_9ASCO|nr:hypothetical protein Cantr_02965 [Candida viswanathii]